MNRAAIETEAEPKPKKRTQEWLDKQAQKNWVEAAYFEDGMFVVPAQNLDAMMRSGSKRTRGLQDKFKYSVTVEEAYVPLLVSQGGKWKPLSGELLDFYLPQYTDLRPAIVPPRTGKKINRCRPKFNAWACEFHVLVEDTNNPDFAVTEAEVKNSLERNSIMGYRPFYGRFKVKEFRKV